MAVFRTVRASDRFVRFQQLIIDNKDLVPPNTQPTTWKHDPTVPMTYLVCVSVVNPFFIIRYDVMNKSLPFLLLKQLFIGQKTRMLLLLIDMEPISEPKHRIVSVS